MLMPAGLQLRREVEAAGSALDASRAGEAELRRELAGERSRRDQQAEEVAGLQSELREARAEAVQGAAAAARMRVLQTDGEDAAAEVAAGLQAELGAALLELREAGAARKGESRAAVRLGAAAFQRGSWMLTTHDRGLSAQGRMPECGSWRRRILSVSRLSRPAGRLLRPVKPSSRRCGSRR